MTGGFNNPPNKTFIMKILFCICFLVTVTGALHPAAAQTPAAATAFNKVIDGYLGVKDALVAANGPQASAKARELMAAIDAVPAAQLSPAQQKAWQTAQPKLLFDSRHISEVDKVPHQREHFATLSANLTKLLKEIPLNKAVLYAETCTMTKNTFLSLSATGRDPYMGMDNCSKVNATLPAAHH